MPRAGSEQQQCEAAVEQVQLGDPMKACAMKPHDAESSISTKVLISYDSLDVQQTSASPRGQHPVTGLVARSA